jgi:hypothetical protein
LFSQNLTFIITPLRHHVDILPIIALFIYMLAAIIFADFSHLHYRGFAGNSDEL